MGPDQKKPPATLQEGETAPPGTYIPTIDPDVFFEGLEHAQTLRRRQAGVLPAYSANNWQSPQYGVGYATASSPLGPFRKSPANPILSQNAQIGMYSTGHGSFATSPDGTELYYVHHGRPTPTEPLRRLYTERAFISGTTLRIDQATSDRPIPSGVAPYALTASPRTLALHAGSAKRVTWRVTSADGAALALANPLNRVQATIANPSVATVDATADGATLTARHRGRTTLTLTYQRERANGTYFDVTNGPWPVTVRVAVIVT